MSEQVEQLNQLSNIGISRSQIDDDNPNNISEDDIYQNSQNLNENTSLNQSKFSMTENNQNVQCNEFKVILVGDCSVGKTSLLNRFVNGDFNENYNSTISVEYKSKVIKLDKFSKAVLKIWDTAGSEKFRSVTRQYFKGSKGIILVFDLTNKDSFSHLKSWMSDIRDNAEKNSEVIVVGNKSDLDENRQVEKEEANKYAEMNNVEYYEASAKDGTNIWLIFETLSRNMNKHVDEEEEASKESYVSKRINVNKTLKTEPKSGCCGN